MQHMGYSNGVGMSIGNTRLEVFKATHSATGNHRNVHFFAHTGNQVLIKAFLRTFFINRR